MIGKSEPGRWRAPGQLALGGLSLKDQEFEDRLVYHNKDPCVREEENKTQQSNSNMKIIQTPLTGENGDPTTQYSTVQS